MKFSFVALFLALPGLAASPAALPSRKQLSTMVEQLQKTPDDDALRGKIIKLVSALKPAPALPAEAERRMARGSAAVKGAASAADFQDAAKEFEAATLAAPWYGDAYFNLGVTQDKAANYESALRSLKLALLAAPGSKEIKALMYEVEYRQEKGSPSALAAKQQSADAALMKSLEGAVFTEVGAKTVEFQYRISNGKAVFWTRRLAYNGGMCYDGSRRDGAIGEEAMCTDDTPAGPLTVPLEGRHGKIDQGPNHHSVTLEISEDGQSLQTRDIWVGDAPKDRVYKRR